MIFILILFLSLSTASAQEPSVGSDQQSAVSCQESAVSGEELSFIQRVENWYADNMNYGTITALMAVESSFIPFPSEVVVPPAAYVAGKQGSALNVTDYYWLNVVIVVLFGTLGALLGAIINYLLSMWLGRPIIYAFADSRLGKVLLLSSDKIRKAEEYFNEHGNMSTFVGRFIPGIRQLISIPAGLAKMNFLNFVGFTTLGAFIWNAILALLGYFAQGQADLINRYSHELSIVLVILTVIAVAALVIRHFVKKRS